MANCKGGWGDTAKFLIPHVAPPAPAQCDQGITKLKSYEKCVFVKRFWERRSNLCESHVQRWYIDEMENWSTKVDVMMCVKRKWRVEFKEFNDDTDIRWRIEVLKFMWWCVKSKWRVEFKEFNDDTDIKWRIDIAELKWQSWCTELILESWSDKVDVQSWCAELK